MKRYIKIFAVILFFSCLGIFIVSKTKELINKDSETATFREIVKHSEGKFEHRIFAIDTHTQGEPTRVIVAGFPEIKGETMMEKRNYVQENYDFLRTALMHEPRGHEDMFGAIVTEPVCEEADIGVIFIEAGGYLNMCGHGTIGLVTAAIQGGIVESTEPLTDVKVDTPAGVVRTRAMVKDKTVEQVTITNVPSFLYKKGVEIKLDTIGKIKVDIAYGGSFFALVDAQQLGIPIEMKKIVNLMELGLEIRKKVNESTKIQHPTLNVTTVDLVEIYEYAGHNHFKNVVIFGEGQFDRSPCGTGTSAKLAALFDAGKLAANQVMINESITGTTFIGKITGTTKVGEYDAIIPEITGTAWITGFSQYVIDPKDPLKYGVSLSRF